MLMERRKSPRRRTREKGKIVFNEERSVIDCMVANLSEMGANLRLPNIAGVPDTFELHFGDQVRAAWVVWKADGTLGVTWIGKTFPTRQM